MNKDYQIKALLEKPVWTTEDCEWLLKVLDNIDSTEFRQLMQRLFNADIENAITIDQAISEQLLSNIHERINNAQKKGKAKQRYIFTISAVAASLIGIVAFSTFLFLKKNTTQPIAQVQHVIKPIMEVVKPGGNKAVLTLADGSTILLDDAKNGALTQQGKTNVIKMEGQLAYSASDYGTTALLYNTITTPRGGQYQVILSDGSKVWLNAASSLKFPTAFNGRQRTVEITGEAYFEVAPVILKNFTAKIPFIVKIITPAGDGGQVEVLGTHFNINAYSDEAALTTTLLEGSVKCVNGTHTAFLKPRQQSQIGKNGLLKVSNGIDVSKVVAWKNGLFDFEGLSFATLAHQIARWYDVELVNDQKVNERFYAQIPRNTQLPELLHALELTGKVHFKLDGKRIIVNP